jgi:hypothetical protein
MTPQIFLEVEFWALIVLSLLLPCGVFFWLIRRRRIARATVAVMGLALVLMAGVDAILLQRLNTRARSTPDLRDDRVFASEYSIALTILPLIMAGIGINLLSHVLHEHLIIAELEYERRSDDPGPPRGT